MCFFSTLLVLVFFFVEYSAVTAAGQLLECCWYHFIYNQTKISERIPPPFLGGVRFDYNYPVIFYYVPMLMSMYISSVLSYYYNLIHPLLN